jgi:hypothetical protein
MVMPDFEHFEDCKQFLVMCIIISFGQAKCPRVKGNGVEFSVRCPNRVYGCDGIV